MSDEPPGYPTREAAIEAWDTWRGRYVEIDPETFCRCNPCSAGGQVVDDEGDYAPFPSDDVVGGSNLLSNGAFTVPWPRLTPGQAAAAVTFLDREDSLDFVASLTARWCALFPSAVKYRATISELLKKNDRDNELLNVQLQKWNEYLSPHGFSPFEENDLRGINLSGLSLEGAEYTGVNLRYVDLSFAECSLAQLRGAYLFGAKLCGISAVYINLSFAIASRADFSLSFLSNAHFEGADLGNAVLADAMCHHACFDGAFLRHANLNNSQCTDISLKPLIYELDGVQKQKPTELQGVVYNGTTFTGTTTEGIDWTKNAALKAEIEKQNRPYSEGPKRSPWNRFIGSIELKPGWLGFSVDLKALLRRRTANKRLDKDT